MMESSAYFLLLKDSCASRISQSEQSTLYVSAGSLWVACQQLDKVDDGHIPLTSEETIHLKSCELINVHLSCSRNDLLTIDETELELLLPVDSFAERKKLSTGIDRLKGGREIYERYLDQFASGQMCEIFVTISNHHGLPDKTCGLIQYVGPLPSCPGVWFGIKLPFVYKGMGSTDGSYKGKRFFECDENTGLFLSIDKIAPYQSNKIQELLEEPGEISLPAMDDFHAVEMPLKPISPNLSKPPLEHGERVVWISDEGPELGTVRWIGILSGAKIKEYTIGVEFDRPIGTGTGKYNNERLFRTAQNHASLIPVLGLMKAEEFFGSKAAVPEVSLSGFQIHHSVSGSLCHQDSTPTSLTKQPSYLGSNVFENPHSSGASDVDSSGDSTSQPSHISSTSSSHKTLLPRVFSRPSDASPSLDSATCRDQGVISDTMKSKVEHCYENVEKDETGRVLNRDSNAFKVVTDSQTDSLGNDYLDFCHQVMPMPTSFHRSFDDIYAENKKRIDSIGMQFYNSMECNKVNRIKISEQDFMNGSWYDSQARSRTLETYSTTGKSLACKVFDENDVPLRLPYTTGRSTFYGRADDDSIHAKDEDFKDERRASKSGSGSNKPHRSIFKFISKHTPNVILQQINKTLKMSLLSQSFHRRCSSDSVPALPQKHSLLRSNLSPLSDTGHDSSRLRIIRAGDRSSNDDTLQLSSPIKDPQVATPVSCNTCETRQIRACSYRTTPTGIFESSRFPNFFSSPLSDDAGQKSPEMVHHEDEQMSDFDVGSRVEVDISERVCHGIIRWMGCFKDRRDILVGLELEEELKTGSDGKIGERRFFSCPSRRAYFTLLHSIRKDSRIFLCTQCSYLLSQCLCKIAIRGPHYFEDSQSLVEAVLKRHPNFVKGTSTSSFTIDAVFFSMFAFTLSFDSMLFVDEGCMMESQEANVRRLLLRDVVNPLRDNLEVNSACLKKVLMQTSTDAKQFELITRDPAGFFLHLMKILGADSFLKFSNGDEAHVWDVQLQEDHFVQTSLHHLVELSFFSANLKLLQTPSCLVLRMERKNDVKCFIVPPVELDITDVLQNGIRECTICGKQATYECRECFQHGHLLTAIVFCDACSIQFHSHSKRAHHKPCPISTEVYHSFLYNETGWVDMFREKLELIAVVCSSQDYCTSFVRAGSKSDTPWLFFDASESHSGDSTPACPQIGVCSFLPGLLSNKIKIPSTTSEMSTMMELFLFNADIFIYQFPPLLLYK